MQTKNTRTLLCCLSMILVAGCDELIEPSLNDSKLNVIAPADNVQSPEYTQTFYWEPIDGATRYQLQIVSPNFDNAARLVTDTSVTINSLTISLAPGQYQWRLRAANNSSRTAYVVRNLLIDTTSLQHQSVQLVAPVSGTVTNVSPFQLSWQNLFGATRYRLQVDNNNFSSGVFLLDMQIPGTSYSFAPAGDGVYQWRVRAENDTISSQFSNFLKEMMKC